MKNRKFIALAVMAMSIAGLAGCGNKKGSSNTILPPSSSNTGTTTGTTGTTEEETTTNTTTTHEHSFGTNWVNNDAKHWHECECGEKSGEAAHTFTEEVQDSRYLKEEANCSHGALYFKSCICGYASSSTTFEVGSALAHTPSSTYQHNDTEHWNTCSSCGEKVNAASHNFSNMAAEPIYLKSNATCSSGAVYYKSCVCGLASKSATFVVGTGTGEHRTSGTWDSDRYHHWKSCSDCGARVGESIHNFSGTSSSSGVGQKYWTVNSKCTVCAMNYSFTADESYDYTYTSTKCPTWTTPGSSTLVVSKNSSSTTYTFALPSFEEDLASERHIYERTEQIINDGYSGETVAFRVNPNLGVVINLIENYSTKTGTLGITEESLVAVLRSELTEIGHYIAGNPVGGSKSYFVVSQSSVITGKGTVAIGVLTGGSYKVGDAVTIYQTGVSPINTIVTGVQVTGTTKVLDSTVNGTYNYDLLLRGVERDRLTKGAVIVKKDNTLLPSSGAKAVIRLLSTEEGGRTNPITSGYKPSVYVNGVDVTTSISFTDSCLYPGDYSNVNLEFISNIYIYNGMYFAVREGGKVVAHGYIITAVAAGATKLQLQSDSDYHGWPDPDYVLDLSYSNAREIIVEPGAKRITLSDNFDGDTGSYLPSFVVDQVENEHIEDIEVTIQVELPNHTICTPFRYSNYNNVGFATNDHGESLLTLAGQPEDCPELFGADGGWNYTTSSTLRLMLFIEVGTNAM